MKKTGDKGLELGMLQPFRALLSEVKRWEEDDRTRRPSDDPALLAVSTFRADLEKAIADAQNPTREPTVAELAEIEGVSTWTIYKRRERERKAAQQRAA